MATHAKFVHLRAHSEYSMGLGTAKISKLVDACKNAHMPALCLADKQNMFGSLEFALKCQENGIQPIAACILDLNYTLTTAAGQHKSFEGEILLIAKNDQGYRNLIRLISFTYLKASGKTKPCISWEQFLELSGDLIILLGHPDSILARILSHERLDIAEAMLETLQQIVINSDICIEISRYKQPNAAHARLEAKLLNLAHKYALPPVATNSIQYIMPQDRESADAMICILHSRYVVEDARPQAHKEHYFRDYSEMQQLFSDIPEALENTWYIAQKCSFMLEKGKVIMPQFAPNQDEGKLLRDESYAGLKLRLSDMDEAQTTAYWERLDFELDVINKMGFPGYFLIVSDFIRWSKQADIPVGPGRGSGAGSLVAWALQITELDPIYFDLLFERFLNAERVSLPDFDIDFCQGRRDEVIQYVKQRYGEMQVAHIVTFGKLQARAVLRDVGRVLHMPYLAVDKLCKMIPNNPAHPITLKEAIDLDPELQKMRNNDQDIAKLLEISLKLEGNCRHVSTHAAGIIIANQSLLDLVPLYHDGESDLASIQYSLKYAEIAGLIKFDFLGLRTLTLIKETCKLIKKEQNITVDFAKIELNDPKTYELMGQGKTFGIFQFEGVGMRDAMKRLKPYNIFHLADLSALYRPGPMEYIGDYIATHHGLRQATYLHPEMEAILSQTNGIIVYQEQVMQIAQKLAGYKPFEADLLRRAMGKKNKQEMEEQRDIFVRRMIERGIDKNLADDIFNLVYKFASYGFNKSHASAYAIISYQTGYLKAHFLIEFLTTIINLEIHNTDKIYACYVDAKQLGVRIAPPDINISDYFFSIKTNNSNAHKESYIQFGLGGIKNANAKVLEKLIEDRDKNGVFNDIFDFIHRTVPMGMNKRLLEALIKAGALQSIETNQAFLLENVDSLLNYKRNEAKKLEEAGNTQQLGLWAMLEAHPASKTKNTGAQDLSADEITQKERNRLKFDIEMKEPEQVWNEKMRMAAEYTGLGFHLVKHPIESYLPRLKKVGFTDSERLLSYINEKEQNFKVAGVITGIKMRSGNKKGSKYAFIKLSDHLGMLDLSIFDSQLLAQHQNNLLKEGNLVLCEVSAQEERDTSRVVIRKLHDIEKILASARITAHIYIKNKQGLQLLQPKIQRHNEEWFAEIRLYAEFEDGSLVDFISEEKLYISEKNLDLLKDSADLRIELQ